MFDGGSPSEKSPVHRDEQGGVGATRRPGGPARPGCPTIDRAMATSPRSALATTSPRAAGTGPSPPTGWLRDQSSAGRAARTDRRATGRACRRRRVAPAKLVDARLPWCREAAPARGTRRGRSHSLRRPFCAPAEAPDHLDQPLRPPDVEHLLQPFRSLVDEGALAEQAGSMVSFSVRCSITIWRRPRLLRDLRDARQPTSRVVGESADGQASARRFWPVPRCDWSGRFRRRRAPRAQHEELSVSEAGEVGWGTWIRTRTNGVRVRGSTVNLFPTSVTLPHMRHGRADGNPGAAPALMGRYLTHCRARSSPQRWKNTQGCRACGRRRRAGARDRGGPSRQASSGTGSPRPRAHLRHGAPRHIVPQASRRAARGEGAAPARAAAARGRPARGPACTPRPRGAPAGKAPAAVALRGVHVEAPTAFRGRRRTCPTLARRSIPCPRRYATTPALPDAPPAHPASQSAVPDTPVLLPTAVALRGFLA